MPFEGFDPTQIVGGRNPVKYAPMSDDTAARRYPQHSWVYNKLVLYQTQGIRVWPHGIEPDQYPAVLKPAINLNGGSEGCRVVKHKRQHRRYSGPLMFATPYIEGPHWSVDVAVVGGVPLWRSFMQGHPGEHFGTFGYWSFEPDPGGVAEPVYLLIKRYLSQYTGMVNAEVRGEGKVIDFHLRDGDSYLMGGSAYVDAVADLYDGHGWAYSEALESGWLFPVFRPEGGGDITSVQQWADATLVPTEGVRLIKWDTTGGDGNPPGYERVCLVVAGDRSAGRRVQSAIRCRLG